MCVHRLNVMMPENLRSLLSHGWKQVSKSHSMHWPTTIREVSHAIATNGCSLLSGVYAEHQVETLRNDIHSALAVETQSVRHRNEQVYAARNLLTLWPLAQTVWQRPVLMSLLSQTLGPNYGLVRGLFFDKPPDQTWALPWHKDLLIAVAANSPQAPGYSRPRERASVPHVEPPLEVLQQMLTLRIHLDDMSPDNGPLQVLPGSQATGKELRITGFEERQILGSAGDVFAMRPLLVHSSGRSTPGTTQHRRIIHLEFSGMPELPGGMQWHTFIKPTTCSEHEA